LEEVNISSFSQETSCRFKTRKSFVIYALNRKPQVARVLNTILHQGKGKFVLVLNKRQTMTPTRNWS